jgi:hypothetical protein
MAAFLNNLGTLVERGCGLTALKCGLIASLVATVIAAWLSPSDTTLIGSFDLAAAGPDRWPRQMADMA